MAKPRINKFGVNIGTGGYSTWPKSPRFKTEKRIKVPQAKKRPIRFQVRTLIRHGIIRKDPYWFTLHRRGPHREVVGINPLEARAVPESLVRGSLPERIVWQYLVAVFKFIPGSDFDFQTSLQGGRIDLGGLVADFVFPYLHIILQVDGPTHLETMRINKDNEQDLTIAEMGYQVYHVPQEIIFDEYRFENFMEKAFNWMHSGGADSMDNADQVPESNGFFIDRLLAKVLVLRGELNGIL